MKKLVSRMLPLLGFLFLTAYLRSATVDVVYTDYIRIINSYLPDVFSFTPYLRADILTRTPICYPERILNVVLFGYSTTFDMILGAAGLTLSALIIGMYAYKKKISAAIVAVLMIIIFSLDKWEMLTNGTGWVHFLTFACFYYHYLVYDRVRSGDGKKGDEVRLCVIPIVTVLLISGSYCPIYVGALFAVYLIDYITGYGESVQIKTLVRRLACIIIPFVLFFISYMLSEEEVAGATSESFFTVIAEDPILPVKMILKSFGSMVIGGETAAEWNIPGILVCIFGLIIILGYVYAIYVNFRSGLYKETAFPMLLLFSGLISHGIVFVTRWIFKSDDYMMSSRYALQFQSGILGMILTFTMADTKFVVRPVSAALIILILAGHLCTSGREINMAKYRRESFENMRSVAVNYRNETADTLKSVLQYHDPAKTRHALEILEENGWNVFGN
ncbi:MAG: hypothetical protein Q4E54_03910 [Lachnospiraceae bacterium]|nr:hypothetical protein [Lachnospiraceae bacterium]